MRYATLGRTGLAVTKTAFGALPLQRLSVEAGVSLLRSARRAGITFYDTARAYSDSECKLGVAFGDNWDGLILATKSGAGDGAQLLKDCNTSLSLLRKECIDIYQFHNPGFVPKPGGEDGLYDAALALKRAGKIRHIGITQHRLSLALEAVESGLYDTLQYPFSHLASREEIDLCNLCEEKGVGFIAMKAMSGGLVTDAALPFAFISGFNAAVPIWGIQREEELSQFMEMEERPPLLDAAMQERIDRDRAELTGAFCRSCGYCLPCPVGIPIHQANRMIQLATRAPVRAWVNPEWLAEMEKIPLCTRCGQCEKRCPYHLKPYDTLPGQLEAYKVLYAQVYGAEA